MNEPPDHTAELRAANLLSLEGITVAKYWREWSDPRLIVCILVNCDLNMVTWEERVLAGDPKFEDSQVLPDVPGARFAESLGLKGIRVEKAEGIGAAWDEALAADRPCVIEFVTDPEVPPLPPHITGEQARNFVKSLLHDPDRAHMLKQSIREMMDNLMK